MTDNKNRRHRDDDEYLQAIREGARTTSDIADALNITRQGADYRLRRLRDDGDVKSKMVGNTLVWSIADKEDEEFETS